MCRLNATRPSGLYSDSGGGGGGAAETTGGGATFFTGGGATRRRSVSISAGDAARLRASSATRA